MLPWLAFSEAIGRAPSGILENRVLVKKVVFPVEILPVTHVISGLVTQFFAASIFIVALLVFRGSVPATIAWLPALLIPQLFFTLGLAWFLSATGVYLRDLGQMIGFLLTLWFFLTPICYELPAGSAAFLAKNPIYVLVRGYRAIFLESTSAAAWSALEDVAAIVRGVPRRVRLVLQTTQELRGRDLRPLPRAPLQRAACRGGRSESRHRDRSDTPCAL